MKKITLNNIIYCLIFLYVLSIYLFTYRAGYNTLSNALAFLVVISIWIKILLTSKKIHFNTVLLFQILFIVFCLITYFYAINPSVVISKVKTLLLIFLVMFTLVNFIDTFDKLRKVILYFVAAGFITSIYILVTSDFSNITRYGSQLGNQNAIGMNLGISSIFCFYIILSEKKFLYSILHLPMIACILLTGSRKALIFIVLNIIVILFFINKNSLSKLVKFVIASICVLLVVYYLIFNIPIFYQIIGERVENLFSFLSGEGTGEASLNNRVEMIKYGMKFFYDNPILGYGIDNYRFLYGGTYSHNNFVELLVGTGAIGFSLFYTTQIIAVMNLIRSSRNKTWSLVCFTFLAIIVSYIVLSPSLVYYDSKHYNILLTIASVVKSIGIRNEDLCCGGNNV